MMKNENFLDRWHHSKKKKVLKGLQSLASSPYTIELICDGELCHIKNTITSNEYQTTLFLFRYQFDDDIILDIWDYSKKVQRKVNRQITHWDPDLNDDSDKLALHLWMKIEPIIDRVITHDLSNQSTPSTAKQCTCDRAVIFSSGCQCGGA